MTIFLIWVIAFVLIAYFANKRWESGGAIMRLTTVSEAPRRPPDQSTDCFSYFHYFDSLADLTD